MWCVRSSVLATLFLVVLACSAALAQSAPIGGGFGSDRSYPVADFPYSVTTADLDGDGALDLVAPNTEVGKVSVLKGNGDGTFGIPTSYDAGNRPREVAVADFDGNGVPDLAVSNVISDDVSVLLGEGAGTPAAPTSPGTFAPAKTYKVGDGPRTIVARDFDGDGSMDLAVVNRWSNNVSVLRGNGDGTFAASRGYPAGVRAYDLTVARLDNDPYLDLAVANREANTVSILMGRPGGAFQRVRNIPAGNGPYALTSADFDGDGQTDLAVGNLKGKKILLYSGRGDGTFAAPKSLGFGTFVFDIETADFDGNGSPDLVIADNPYAEPSFNGYAGGVTVLKGNGDGTFKAPTKYGSGVRPVAVAGADLDGDSKADIVTANQETKDLSVMLGSDSGIDLSAGDGRLTFGGGTTLSGRLLNSAGVPLANERVILEWRPWAGDPAKGPFLPVAGQPKDANGKTVGVITGPDGSFRLPGVEPRWTTDYRARFAGNGTDEPVTSPVEVVEVETRVSLNLSRSSTKPGGGLSIYGAIFPGHHDMPVNLIIERNGSPLTTKTTSVDAASRFKLYYEPPQAGYYSVEARFPNHPPGHLGNASHTKRFRALPPG